MKIVERSNFLCLASLILMFVLANPSAAQHTAFKLDNPISVSYLKKNLSKESPRLILTPQIEQELKRKLKSDALVQKYYNYLQKEADTILTKPLLERELEGFRLLFVSREMLKRMTTLCMVYRIDKSQDILNRIDAELNTVCNFVDWNPQHFLDIAEMSLAVALAIDWVGNALPAETVRLAKTSLVERGIHPSFNVDGERMFIFSILLTPVIKKMAMMLFYEPGLHQKPETDSILTGNSMKTRKMSAVLRG